MASRVPRPEDRRPAADRWGAAALGCRIFRRQMAAVLTAARDANAYSASFRLGAGPVAGFTIYFHSGAEEYRHAERPPDDDATLHAHDDPCKPPADAQPQARRRGARGGKNHCGRDRTNSTGSSTAGAAAVGRTREENARRPEAAEHDSDAREARPGNPPTGRTAERQSCPPPSTASVPPPTSTLPATPQPTFPAPGTCTPGGDGTDYEPEEPELEAEEFDPESPPPSPASERAATEDFRSSEDSTNKTSPEATRPEKEVDEWEEETWEYQRKGACRSFTRGRKRAPPGDQWPPEWARRRSSEVVDKYVSHGWGSDSPQRRR